MKKIAFTILFAFSVLGLWAQDIPHHISYTRIYDFLDELAADNVIELNSVAKPYSRKFIADKLLEAQGQTSLLNNRQRKDLSFFLNEFALERNELPDGKITIFRNEKSDMSLIQPAFHYNDSSFRARVTPLLGMHIWKNNNGTIIKRWVGAELQMMIGKNLTVYGSLRDNSFDGDLLSRPAYLNNYPGAEYKEADYGGDFSDSRGGIKYAWKTGSVGLVKDNIVWGDNYNGSNILSGRAPSFPMLTFHLKPAKWFEMQYFHGWLVSNVLDSTRYYVDNQDNRHYRNANKFMAANMFTFTPIPHLNLSFGNSIVYSESNVHPSYFIPVAFYKSLDHVLTKGLGIENQNSQLFLNFSSRNIKHLHFYTSVFADEISFSRFKKSNPQKNPFSYKVGASLTNFPIQNVSIVGEFTCNNIITYKHSVPTLTWASNGYNLGHYLGDNSQELYAAVRVKPIRGLDVTLSYVNAKHGNEYEYKRSPTSTITNILSQPVMNDVVWTNQTVGLKATYEIISNGYAFLNAEYSNIQGHDAVSAVIDGETRLDAQGYLDLYTPAFLQGENLTFMIGFGFGF